MMMAETMTQMFNVLNTNSKRTYKKQKDLNNDTLSIYSSKNSVSSSTTNTNDWHRLLLASLKPGVTGKYRMRKKNGNQSITSSSTSCEDSTVTLQSYNDDSLIIDDRQIIITHLDASKQSDFSIENSLRRDNHYVKNSMTNRSDDHMTSLKRRVRKQQMRHIQNQASILQETTFQLPSPTNLLLMAYPEQPVTSRRYRPKNSNYVSLPLLINPSQAVPLHLQNIKLNLYGY